MTIIEPPVPCSTSTREVSRIVKNAPSTFVAMTARYRSVVDSWNFCSDDPDAGVDHHDVEPTEVVDERRDTVGHGLLVGDVDRAGRHTAGEPPDVGRGLRELVLAPAPQGDIGAGTGEIPGHAETDPRGSTRDESALACEVEDRIPLP